MSGKRPFRRVASRGVAAVVLGVWVAACGGDVVPDEQDAIDRELELALDTEAEPELADEGTPESPGETVVEATPAPPPPPPPPSSPVRPAPTPEPTPPPAPAPEVEPEPAAAEPPEPRYIETVASVGSELEIEMLQALSTGTNRPGDRFTAAVVRPLIDANRVIVPLNARVRGEVTALQKSGGSGQEAIIKVSFIDVSFNGETWPLSASVVEANPETQGRLSTGDKAARIGAGAAAGAILGRIIGGNTRGTVIGAAVGAAAGTAITLATEDVDAVLPEGSVLRLRLDEPLVIRVVDPEGGV